MMVRIWIYSDSRAALFPAPHKKACKRKPARESLCGFFAGPLRPWQRAGAKEARQESRLKYFLASCLTSLGLLGNRKKRRHDTSKRPGSSSGFSAEIQGLPRQGTVDRGCLISYSCNDECEDSSQDLPGGKVAW